MKMDPPVKPEDDKREECPHYPASKVGKGEAVGQERAMHPIISQEKT